MLMYVLDLIPGTVYSRYLFAKELTGIEQGEFEINASHNLSSSVPDIPLTDLNTPVPVAVVVAGRAPRRYRIQAMARRLINGVTWKYLAVGGVLTCLVGILLEYHAGCIGRS